MPSVTQTQLFRKPVVAPGTYHTPEGTISITPQRITGWVDSFRRMKQGGIAIPVPWGHQSRANPVEPTVQALQDERNFLKSRYNATYVEDLQVNDRGELEMAAPPPPGYRVDMATGALVNDRDGTQIKEVSSAICDWKDGQGTTWRDCIRHIALTPLPVAAGQPGFTMGTEPDDSPCTNCFTLSTNTMSEKTPPGGNGNGGTSEKPTASPDSDKPIIDFGTGDPASSDVTPRLLELLRKAKLPLPDDTTDANFKDRLLVALEVLCERQAPTPTEQPAPPAAPPQPGDDQISEETPPMMMSLDRITDPLTLRLAKRMQVDDQTRRKRLIVNLSRRMSAAGIPYLRPSQVQELERAASHATFALDPESGEPAETELDRQLKLLDAVLKDHGKMATVDTLADDDTDEETPPEKLTKKGAEDAGNSLCKAVGRVPVAAAAE